MDWLLPEIGLAPSDLSATTSVPLPEWPHPTQPNSTRSAASSSDTLMEDLLSTIDRSFSQTRHSASDVVQMSPRYTQQQGVSRVGRTASLPSGAVPNSGEVTANRSGLLPLSTAELLCAPSGGRKCTSATSLLFRSSTGPTVGKTDNPHPSRAGRHGDVHFRNQQEYNSGCEEELAGDRLMAVGGKAPREVRAIRRREFHKIHTRRSRAKLNDKMDKLLAALPAPPPGVVIKSKAQILDYAITVLSAPYSHCAQHQHHHTASSS